MAAVQTIQQPVTYENLTYNQIITAIANYAKKHDMKDIIASNLKALRKTKGYSMRTVALKIFVSTAAYQKYEEKRSEPGIGTLKRIAELYGITVDEIIKEVKIV